MSGYDAECEELCRRLNAVGVFIIVIEGDRGNGMSFSTREPALNATLPALLRHAADGIAKQHQQEAN